MKTQRLAPPVLLTRIAFVLAAGLTATTPALADTGPCQTVAAKRLESLGIAPTEVKDISMIRILNNPEFGTIRELQAWATEADMVRFEQVNQEILTDDMTEMLRNNPPDVVYAAFRDAFFQGAIRMFQRDNEMRNIVLTDPEARDKATRHFFNRALREVREDHRA